MPANQSKIYFTNGDIKPIVQYYIRKDEAMTSIHFFVCNGEFELTKEYLYIEYAVPPTEEIHTEHGIFSLPIGEKSAFYRIDHDVQTTSTGTQYITSEYVNVSSSVIQIYLDSKNEHDNLTPEQRKLYNSYMWRPKLKFTCPQCGGITHLEQTYDDGKTEYRTCLDCGESYYLNAEPYGEIRSEENNVQCPLCGYSTEIVEQQSDDTYIFKNRICQSIACGYNYYTKEEKTNE